MNLIKIAAGLFAAASLTVLSAYTVSAEEAQSGWTREGKRLFYYREDGTPASGETELDGETYLFAPNGALQTGWQTVGGVRRYYDSDGQPVTGWLEWRGEQYYVDAEAGKLSGAAEIEGVTYQFGADGTLLHDTWTEEDGKPCYRGADGAPAEGETNIDGIPYFFDAGTARTGFLAAADGTVRLYALTEDGLPYTETGWLELPEGRFYADAERGILTGLQEIDGITFGFDENGAARSGLQQSDGQWRCFSETGEMLTGWQEADGLRRYFGGDGTAVCGKAEIDGERYFFSEEGVMQTGFVTEDDETSYYGEDGIMRTGWQEIDGNTFYFGASGAMAVGTVLIDGAECSFLENGVYQKPVCICLDAGHYGKYNQSPVNPVYYESDFTWKMHLYLKEELEARGIEVITTRPNQETDLALEERGKMSEGCDLFLSLHSNATFSPAADGPLACCAINGSADALGLALANCIRDVMQTTNGASIWKRVGDRGDWYGVLRGATSVGTPAILLEHSYHTNLRATNWLLVDSNIRMMAKAEAELLAEWFGVKPKAVML